MKKLSLKQLNLGNAEVLTREQLKKVLGGQVVQTTGCKDQCETDSQCPSGYSCYEATFPDGAKCKRCIENPDLMKLFK